MKSKLYRHTSVRLVLHGIKPVKMNIIVVEDSNAEDLDNVKQWNFYSCPAYFPLVNKIRRGARYIS